MLTFWVSNDNKWEAPPSSAESYRQSIYHKQIRTEMESGLVRSRPKHTRSRHMFTLGWRNLKQSEYDTLKTFFTTNIGTTFTFYHPLTNIPYLVRFVSDELPEISHTGFLDDELTWSLNSLKLEEV